MQSYQHRFLQLALACAALRFGQFTLKSGRRSPYFFNAGQFHTGGTLAVLGECYAETALASGLAFDLLFGPAYKGIPLATAMAVALAQRGRDVPVAFNRKEAKTHGEGGHLIGAPLRGKVLIVDDVITAGTAVRESVALISAAGAKPAGLIIALDRQERGQGQHSAAQEFSAEFGIPVLAVVTLADLLAFSQENLQLQAVGADLIAYRAEYGVKNSGERL